MGGGVGSLRREAARAIVDSRQWIERGNEKSPARAVVPRIKKARRTSGRRTKHASPDGKVARRSAEIVSTWRRSAVKGVARVAPAPDGVPLPNATSQWSKIGAASPAQRGATRPKPAEGRPRASRPYLTLALRLAARCFPPRGASDGSASRSVNRVAGGTSAHDAATRRHACRTLLPARAGGV